MLALVKKPRIEISLQGEHVNELIEWISKKFEVSILTSDNSESVAVEETDFWKEMQSNRIGNLLAGSRLKAKLSQTQLAEKLGIRQNMISDYETGFHPQWLNGSLEFFKLRLKEFYRVM
jgi:DNA-binding XRE family transcriptional regulator